MTLQRDWAIRAAVAVATAALVSAQPPREAATVIGTRAEHVVGRGDTLTAIGARYGMEAVTLARRNGLKPGGRLDPGTRLTLDARHIVPRVPGARIVINVPQRMLFLFDVDGTVRGFPVALGRPDWRTPIGRFSVLVKETDPTWDVPLSIQEEMRCAGQTPLVRVPPGPANPLGKYWIGLSLPGVGIHGTNAPASIYTFGTHGCIRVHPELVQELFERVEVGTPGEVIYQPALVTVSDGRVLVEVHRDVYRRGGDALRFLQEAAAAMGIGHLVDAAHLRHAVDLKEGVAVDVTAVS